MPTTVEGVVSRVNGNGFKINGEEEWRNISKYGKDVAMPAMGSRVKITLDGAGFVRKVEPAAVEAPVIEQPGPIEQPKVEGPRVSALFDKDVRITRMAAINASFELLAGQRPVVFGRSGSRH